VRLCEKSVLGGALFIGSRERRCVTGDGRRRRRSGESEVWRRGGDGATSSRDALRPSGAGNGGLSRWEGSVPAGTVDGNLRVSSSSQGTGEGTAMSGRCLRAWRTCWHALMARRGLC